VTPDSFFDGGRFNTLTAAVQRAEKLVQDGADLLEIGGESSRPGAKPISAQLEIERVLPTIIAIRKNSSIPISIDTTKSEVARAALDAGADMINDISAMTMDPKMPDLILEKKCAVCLMHMQGNPQTMQQHPRYNDVVMEVMEFLRRRAAFAVQAGTPAGCIIVDPGIGFGKQITQNLQLIRSIPKLKTLGYPVLMGVSRKSFIQHLLNVKKPADRLGGSLGAQLYCALQGADLIRTHDAKETRQALAIFSMLQDKNYFPKPD